MCIRDSGEIAWATSVDGQARSQLDLEDQVIARVLGALRACLLYTSDAADERSSVDLGGRRIIKKKKRKINRRGQSRNIRNKTTSCTRQ